MKIISTRAHTITGLVVGAILLVAPNLLGFADVEAAAMVARLVGVFILLNELITTSPYSPLKLVPMKVHIALDCLTGLFLALSPWLFAFADEKSNAWVPHLIVGILVVGYALMTDTADDQVKSVAQ
jgi:SPW repeat-containing protein